MQNPLNNEARLPNKSPLDNPRLDHWITKTPNIVIKRGAIKSFDIVLFLKYEIAIVNNGPVFANNVAFAIEVFLTPQKKLAKCRPKKNPAKTVGFFAEFLSGIVFLNKQ